MAFPADPLDVRVELLLPSGWSDITSDVLGRGDITITRGRGNEQTRTAVTRGTMQLNNRSNKYSLRNAASPLFGLVGRNTQLRARVEGVFPTPSVRATTTVESGTTGSFTIARPAGTAAGDVLVLWHTSDVSTLDQMEAPDGGEPWTLLTSSDDDGQATKVWWRIANDSEPASWTLTQDSNSDGVVALVAVQHAAPVAPVVALLSDGTPGTTPDTPSTTPAGDNDLELRWVGTSVGTTWTPPAGFAELADLDSGGWVSGTLAERDLTSGAATGVRAFTAAATLGESHGVTVNVMADSVRLHGEVPAWPPQQDQSGTDVWVDLEVAGIRRRLDKGKKPTVSTPREYIPGTNPVTYWSLEEGPLASRGAADVGTEPLRPFVGTHPSGAVITYPQWGRGDLAPWLAPVVSRSGNAGFTVLWAPVAMAAGVTTWTVDMMWAAGTDAGDATIDINPSYLGGSTGWPQLRLLPDVEEVEVAMNGEPEVGNNVVDLFDGRAHHIRWTVSQAGAKVSWTVHVDGLAATSGTTSGNMTLPSVQWIGLLTSAEGGTRVAQGHVGIWAGTPPTLADAVSAAHGYRSETAARRLVRLCRQAGITLLIHGDLDDTPAMGPQRTVPRLESMGECETADGGVLFEPRGCLGLEYRTRASMQNQTAALELDYSAKQLSTLTSTDDDQLVVNDVTATRLDGGEQYRAVQETGPLSTEEPPDGVGQYDTPITANVDEAASLPDVAEWRRHLGTWDEARYPVVGVSLARAPFVADPSLTLAAARLDIGHQLAIDAVPAARIGPDLVNQLAQGYRERISNSTQSRGWDLDWNCTPAGPWTVAVADGEPRVPADGSTLASTLTISATSLSLASTTENGVWSVDAADYPQDIRVGGPGGERMTVTAISGSTSPQTATVTRGVNGVQREWAFGTPVDVWLPAIAA